VRDGGMPGGAQGAAGLASIDGALRKAAAGGGVAAVVGELAAVATAAGLSWSPPTDAVCSDAACTGKDGQGWRELELRLPGSRGAGARVLVEDVTEVRAQAQEERRRAVARQEFFTLRRYLPFAHKLIAAVGGEWLALMSDAQVSQRCTCTLLGHSRSCTVRLQCPQQLQGSSAAERVVQNEQGPGCTRPQLLLR
jgi:hypothetical protein